MCRPAWLTEIASKGLLSQELVLVLVERSLQ